tara:strand:- start:967 stop:1119 length:153 start_codon:yes stop_codon:yes gene_type:complete
MPPTPQLGLSDERLFYEQYTEYRRNDMSESEAEKQEREDYYRAYGVSWAI